MEATPQVYDNTKPSNRVPYGTCPDCLTEMKNLKTRDGDPEGIRCDQICPKCECVYGCTKACQVFLRNKYGSRIKNWRPLVEGDPEEFSLGSNHLRAMIATLRNYPDAGPKVLEYLKNFEQVLDEQAADLRD